MMWFFVCLFADNFMLSGSNVWIEFEFLLMDFDISSLKFFFQFSPNWKKTDLHSKNKYSAINLVQNRCDDLHFGFSRIKKKKNPILTATLTGFTFYFLHFFHLWLLTLDFYQFNSIFFHINIRILNLLDSQNTIQIDPRFSSIISVELQLSRTKQKKTKQNNFHGIVKYFSTLQFTGI